MRMDLMREGGGGARLSPAQRRMKPKRKKKKKVWRVTSMKWFQCCSSSRLFPKFSVWMDQTLTVNGVISWCCEAKKKKKENSLYSSFSHRWSLWGKSVFGLDIVITHVGQYFKLKGFRAEPSWVSLTFNLLIKHDRCRRDIAVRKKSSPDLTDEQKQLRLRWVLLTHLTF